MSPLATSAAEVVARLRSADPQVRRGWLRRAVAVKSRRRRAAAHRIAWRLR